MTAPDIILDLYDVSFENRTYEMVRDHYYRQFPLLRAFGQLTELHNSDPDRSINEPAKGGKSTLEIAELALRSIGKPPRDLDDVKHAESHVRLLRREMQESYPIPDPDLAEAIIAIEYPWAGCVSTAEDFVMMATDDKIDHVDGIVEELHDRLTKGQLHELLMLALPDLYRQITDHDDARRNRVRLTTVSGDGGNH